MSDLEHIREKREDFERIVEIVRHLPAGWEAKAHLGWAIEVRHKDGYSLLFSRKHSGDKRWRVFGMWPKDREGRSWPPLEEPEIFVSVTRDPKAIAADIERRFLPKYLDKWQTMKRRAEEHANFRERVQAVHERLKPICKKSDGVYAFRVDTPEWVALDIRCRPDVVEKIVNLLVEDRNDASVDRPDLDA